MSNIERVFLVAMCAGMAAIAGCGGGSKHPVDGGSMDAASGTSGSGGRGTGGSSSGRGMTMTGGGGMMGAGGAAGSMSSGGSGSAGMGAAGETSMGGTGSGGEGAGGTGGTSAGSGGTGSGGEGAGGTGGGGGTGTGGISGSGGAGTGGGGSGGAGTGGGSGSGGAGAGGAGGNGGQGGMDNSMDAGVEEDAGPGSISVPLALSVAPDLKRHPISPLIYGINGAAAASASGAKLVRLGGLFATGYNWEINATDVNDNGVNSNEAFGSGPSAASAATEVLAAAQANGGLAMLSVSMADYVAADTTAGDVTATTNYLSTRFVQNFPAKGSAFLTVPDTGDSAVYQDEFVNWVMNQTQLLSDPVVFSLDNQPGIWWVDHASFEPTQLDYDGVVQRTIAYSGAIKAAWPEAPVSGPVGYGWREFLSLQNSPDYPTKGDFIEYYLDHMATASSSANKRLLDYLDIHWWPDIYVDNAVRIIDDNDNSAAAVAARLAAPRSLWDSTYAESSWIAAEAQGLGGNIDLIHRMQNKINQFYPGTKLAVSAWYYGGGNHISGAIASADVLGIFGRENVGLAAVELPGGPSVYTLAAFQVFLNYDGAGAHFGDTSVAATSDDVEGSSVYASVNSAADSEVVIVVLNKRSETRTTSLHIGGANGYVSCDLYQLTSSSPALVPVGTIGSDGSNGFGFDMPPMSVMVLVPH